MRVLFTFFLNQFPHLPVYEMSNGDIRIPFVNPKTGAVYYMLESEFTKGVSDNEQLKSMRKPFSDAKLEIAQLKSAKTNKVPADKKILSISGKQDVN